MISRIKWHLSCLIKSFISLISISKISSLSSNTILIVSNALNEGGAPLVLFEAMKILKKDYNIVLVSPDVGIIGKKSKENDIIVLCSRYFKKSIKRKLLSKKWRLIIVNTLVMYDWVKEIDDKNECIWWIHEGLTYAKKYKEQLNNINLNKNIKIYCVSEWSKNNMNKYGLQTEKRILYYGAKDIVYKNYNKKETIKNKVKFLLIGAICERKRTIDLIDSIQKIPNSILSEMEFTIIGKPLNDEPDYYEKFINKLQKSKKKIEYIKSVPHDKIFEKYNQSDVVLDLSDDDPLPVVVTEAFILKKCVLLSSNCGQYDLIKNGINGYTFSACNIEELKDKLILIYNNKERLNTIGEESRLLYEKLFTIEKFESELKKIIKNSIRR